MPCHVMPCHAILYMSLLPSEHHTVCCRLSLGKTKSCHVMSCHTINVLTATRMSHGLLSPVIGGSKSCGNRLHHAIPYMSLPSACHIVCCLPSCHVSPYNTIQHFNQHVTWSVDSLWGNKVTPHTTSVITSHHTTA